MNWLLSLPAVPKVDAALETGLGGALGGAWGSASALITAELYRNRPTPLLVIVSGSGDGFLEDLATFNIAAEEFPEPAGENRFLQAQRFQRAQEFRKGRNRVLVATPAALQAPLPSVKIVEKAKVVLRVGEERSFSGLVEAAIDAGYERAHSVESPGEIAVRGGLIDLFPHERENPVRLDFFGNELDSLRTFSVETQRSVKDLREVSFSLLPLREATGLFWEYLPPETRIVHRDLSESLPPHCPVDRILTLSSLPLPEEEGAGNVKTLSLERFSGKVSEIPGELSKLEGEIHVYCANEGEESRLEEVLRDAGFDRPVTIRRGRLQQGFSFPEQRRHFVPHHDLFRRYRINRVWGKRPDSRPVDSYLELEEGDIVVHLHHGIGKYTGIETLREGDFMVLRYAGNTKVFVPVADLDLVQKYIGGGENPPALHTLGGSAWSAAKARTQEAVEGVAKEMVQIQAVRKMDLGIRYPPDTDWQRAFELAFPYEETPDQLEVNGQIKRDLESPHPMDRLLCGDVGYGKTELAMRAAFKAATFNRQVAVLVPTTLLARQHWRTFSERMADYPVRVEELSRFRSKKEQKAILADLANGKIDVIVGTHRLVQKDVRFGELGLVILDEEQRFGVEHKEFLKGLRATVDVLTLSATPIPRTLHMALLGIREISSLQTPPRERRAIRTEVLLRDERRIRAAILEEVGRGGQVYFVHNRVYSIESVMRSLERIVPEARFGMGHGRMSSDELEQVMIDFVEHRVDVFVCTTIIESGLDIPNVNTILIDNADQFGLSDLHQLRGRVGRYHRQAHCYLLLPTDRKILPQAKKRIKAIEEFSDLGAGFKIAMRDLEIRGVGNLLGREQSGHIAAVGYDLYLRMLDRATKKMKDREIDEPVEVTVELKRAGYIPEEYAPDLPSRVELYRRLTGCATEEQLHEARAEMEDRFGKLPPPLERFLEIVRLKQLCRRWEITCLSPGRDAWVGTFRNRRKIQELQSRSEHVRVVDDRTIWIVGTRNLIAVLEGS